MKNIVVIYANRSASRRLYLDVSDFSVDDNKTLQEIADRENAQVKRYFDKTGVGRFAVTNVYEVKESLALEWTRPEK